MANKPTRKRKGANENKRGRHETPTTTGELRDRRSLFWPGPLACLFAPIVRIQPEGTRKVGRTDEKAHKGRMKRRNRSEKRGGGREGDNPTLLYHPVGGCRTGFSNGFKVGWLPNPTGGGVQIPITPRAHLSSAIKSRPLKCASIKEKMVSVYYQLYNFVPFRSKINKEGTTWSRWECKVTPISLLRISRRSLPVDRCVVCFHLSQVSELSVTDPFPPGTNRYQSKRKRKEKEEDNGAFYSY